MQSVCYEDFYFSVYKLLNMPLIFDQFWAIWGTEKKKIALQNNFWFIKLKVAP